MSARKNNRRKLSDAQLELMNIIWEKGEATVADVWKALPRERHTARSTVMTLLVRLARKGWLRRRKSGNKYIYSPPAEKQEVLGGIVSRLVKTAFGGSAEGLVAALVNTHGITEEEAEHLQDIIAQAEKKGRTRH